MISGKYIKQEPKYIKIDLDWHGYGLDWDRPIKAIIVRYEGKEYVAKLSDLIDALVSSGLFKVGEEKGSSR